MRFIRDKFIVIFILFQIIGAFINIKFIYDTSLFWGNVSSVQYLRIVLGVLPMFGFGIYMLLRNDMEKEKRIAFVHSIFSINVIVAILLLDYKGIFYDDILVANHYRTAFVQLLVALTFAALAYEKGTFKIAFNDQKNTLFRMFLILLAFRSSFFLVDFTIISIVNAKFTFELLSNTLLSNSVQLIVLIFILLLLITLNKGTNTRSKKQVLVVGFLSLFVLIAVYDTVDYLRVYLQNQNATFVSFNGYVSESTDFDLNMLIRYSGMYFDLVVFSIFAIVNWKPDTITE